MCSVLCDLDMTFPDLKNNLERCLSNARENFIMLIAFLFCKSFYKQYFKLRFQA